MNPAHLHILLNHFPTVGLIVAFGLFLGALFKRNDDLKQGALVALVGIALVTIPAYLSGNAA
jgi:hypothetical protein